MRQEPVPPGTVGNQSRIKRADIPVEKYIADVEDDGANRGQTRSALARLEATVGLVDHIGTAMATHDLAVAVAILQRLEAVADLHGISLINRGLLSEGAG
jgi:hypothetical protein